MLAKSIARVDLQSPQGELFSTALRCTYWRSFDNDDWRRLVCQRRNDDTARDIALPQKKRVAAKKKPGSKEPGLRYWPREADTITFQEGLLSVRATGGGGHMRDATAQRVNNMIPIGSLHQPSEPHVSHAETGALFSTVNYEGQRCALLT